MNLTTEQIAAVKHGEPVHLIVPDAGEVVVVRADVYEKLQSLLYDDGDLTVEEMRILAVRTFEDADTSGPIR